MAVRLCIMGRTLGRDVILIVEDDPSVRCFTGTILKNNGFSVIEAESAHEGLSIFRERRGQVDLILTDVVMPSMTGTEMAEEILRMDPSMPVILMTGSAFAADLPASLPVLTKPFTMQALVETVKSSLSPATLSR